MQQMVQVCYSLTLCHSHFRCSSTASSVHYRQQTGFQQTSQTTATQGALGSLSCSQVSATTAKEFFQMNEMTPQHYTKKHRAGCVTSKHSEESI